jgi:hypothetical protein
MRLFFALYFSDSRNFQVGWGVYAKNVSSCLNLILIDNNGVLFLSPFLSILRYEGIAGN